MLRAGSGSCALLLCCRRRRGRGGGPGEAEAHQEPEEAAEAADLPAGVHTADEDQVPHADGQTAAAPRPGRLGAGQPEPRRTPALTAAFQHRLKHCDRKQAVFLNADPQI